MNLLFSIALLVTTSTTFAQYDSTYESKEHSKKQVEPKKPPHKWMRGCYGYVCPPPQVCRTTKGVPECVDVPSGKSSAQKKVPNVRPPVGKTGLESPTQEHGSPYGPRYSTPTYPQVVTQKFNIPHNSDLSNFPQSIPGFRLKVVTQRPSNVPYSSSGFPQQMSPNQDPTLTHKGYNPSQPSYATPSYGSHPSLQSHGNVPYGTPNYNQINQYAVSDAERQGISNQQGYTTLSYDKQHGINSGNALHPIHETRNYDPQSPHLTPQTHFINPNEVAQRHSTTNPSHPSNLYVPSHETSNYNQKSNQFVSQNRDDSSVHQGRPNLQYGTPDYTQHGLDDKNMQNEYHGSLPTVGIQTAPNVNHTNYSVQGPGKPVPHETPNYNTQHHDVSRGNQMMHGQGFPHTQQTPNQYSDQHRNQNSNFGHNVPNYNPNITPQSQDYSIPNTVQQREGEVNYKHAIPEDKFNQDSFSQRPEVLSTPDYSSHSTKPQNPRRPTQKQHPFNYKEITDALSPRHGDLPPVQIEVGHKPKHPDYATPDRGLMEPVYKTKYSPQHHSVNQHSGTPETNPQTPHKSYPSNPRYLDDLTAQIEVGHNTNHSNHGSVDHGLIEPLHKTSKYSPQEHSVSPHDRTPENGPQWPYQHSQKHGIFNDTHNRDGINLRYGDLSVQIGIGQNSSHMDYNAPNQDSIEPLHKTTYSSPQHHSISPYSRTPESDPQSPHHPLGNPDSNRDAINLRYGDLSAQIKVDRNSSHTDYETIDDGLIEPLHKTSKYDPQQHSIGPHGRTQEGDPHTPYHPSHKHGVLNDTDNKDDINLRYGDVSVRIGLGHDSNHTDYEAIDDGVIEPLHKTSKYTPPESGPQTKYQPSHKHGTLNNTHNKDAINLRYKDLSVEIGIGQNSTHLDHEAPTQDSIEPLHKTTYSSPQHHSINTNTRTSERDRHHSQKQDTFNNTHNEDGINLRYGDLSAQIKFGRNSSHANSETIKDDLIEPLHKKTQYSSQQHSINQHSITSENQPQIPYHHSQNQDALNDTHNTDTINLRYGNFSAEIDVDKDLVEPLYNLTKYGLQYQEQPNRDKQKTRSQDEVAVKHTVPDYNQQRTSNNYDKITDDVSQNRNFKSQDHKAKNVQRVPYSSPNHPTHYQGKSGHVTTPENNLQYDTESRERSNEQYSPAGQKNDRLNLHEVVQGREGSLPHYTTPNKQSPAPQGQHHYHPQQEHNSRTHHYQDGITHPKTGTYNINGALHNCSLLHPHHESEHHNQEKLYQSHNYQNPSGHKSNLPNTGSFARDYESRHVSRNHDKMKQNEYLPNVRHAIPVYSAENPIDDQQVPENLRMTTKPGYDLSRTQSNSSTTANHDFHHAINESVPAPRHIEQSHSAYNSQHDNYKWSSQHTTPNYNPQHPQQDHAFSNYQHTAPGYSPHHPQQSHDLPNPHNPTPYLNPHRSPQDPTLPNVYHSTPMYNAHHLNQDYPQPNPQSAEHHGSLNFRHNTSIPHDYTGSRHPQDYNPHNAVLNSQHNSSIPYHPSQGHAFNPQHTTPGYGAHHTLQGFNPQHLSQDPHHNTSIPQHSSQDHAFNPHHATPGYGQRHPPQGDSTPNYNPHHPSQGHQHHPSEGHNFPNTKHISTDPHLLIPYHNTSIPQHPSQGHAYNPQHITPGYGQRHAPQGHALPNPQHSTPNYNSQHPSQGHSFPDQQHLPESHGFPNAKHTSSDPHFPVNEPVSSVRHIEHSNAQRDHYESQHTTPSYNPRHPPQGHSNPQQIRPDYNPQYPQQSHPLPGYGPQHPFQGHDALPDSRHTTPSYNPHHPPQGHNNPSHGDVNYNSHHTTPNYNPQHGIQVPQHGGTSNIHHPPQIYGSTLQPQHQGYGIPPQPLYPNLHPSQRQSHNRQGTTPQPYHKGYPGQLTNRRYQQYYPAYPYQQNYGNIYPISYGKNGGYRPTPAYPPKQQYLNVPS